MADGECIDKGCEAKITEVDDSGELRNYLCDKGHRNKRRVFHKNVETFETDSGETGHYTASVILYNDNKELYLQERAAAPEGWTIPAGHVDNGEDIEDAAKRELREETGIAPKESESELEKLGVETLENDRCTKGANTHEWHIYCLEVPVETSIELSQESKQYKWFEERELETIKLTPAVEKLYKTDFLGFD